MFYIKEDQVRVGFFAEERHRDEAFRTYFLNTTRFGVKKDDY